MVAYQAPLPDIDVRDEVEYLPHELRAVVVLCYLEGLTHEQAARRLGWPVGTVRSRLARARDRLRADLIRRGTGPPAALMPMLAFKKIVLPQGLIDATVRAGILLSARDAGEAGLVSASAVALTEGVLRTMLVSKFKVIAVILIAVGALTSGVGLFAYQDIGSGAAPRAKGSGSVAGTLPTTSQATGDRWTISVKELDAYAAQVEQLVRRARQEQAAGEWDAAARDLRKSVEVTGEWRDAMMNGRRSEKSTTLPPLPVAPIPLGPQPGTVGIPGSSGYPDPRIVGTSPTGMGGPPIAGTSPPRSAECRLADLESKVDRILRALEKDGNEHTEGPKTALPKPNPGTN
jgi:predicted DNA-binding protein (UPF0251 family)